MVAEMWQNGINYEQNLRVLPRTPVLYGLQAAIPNLPVGQARYDRPQGVLVDLEMTMNCILFISLYPKMNRF
jgi:hypothetical protein